MMISVACMQVCLPAAAQKKIQLTSPDGNIIFSLKPANKAVKYSVQFKGRTIVDFSSLSLQFDNGSFKNNPAFNKPIFTDTTEDYELVVGKTKQVHSHYKQAVIPIGQKISPYWKINLIRIKIPITLLSKQKQ